MGSVLFAVLSSILGEETADLIFDIVGSLVSP